MAVDSDKYQALEELQKELEVVLAKAICKNISRNEVHAMIDNLFNNYMSPGQDCGE